MRRGDLRRRLAPPIMFRATPTENEWKEIRKLAIDARMRNPDLVAELIRRGLASRKAEAAAA